MCAAQLGDNTLDSRYTPVAVYGLSSGVIMVAAGMVRARVVCCGYLWVLEMGRVFVSRACHICVHLGQLDGL